MFYFIKNREIFYCLISQGKTNEKTSVNQDKIDSINLKDVYAISPLYNQWNWLINNNENQSGMTVSTSMNKSLSLLSTNPPLRGFQLHSYDRIGDNILQEVRVIFQSNLSNQIEQWYQLLSKMISECMIIFLTEFYLFFLNNFFSDKPPRNILVICNPYAGSRHSRHTYNTKIKPIFERAQYNVTYLGT